MNCANKALLVLLAVVMVGLWGCSQGSGPAPGSARLRELEARHAKLEEDYRATVTARDEARKNLATAERDRSQLREQLAQLTRERDELREQVTARCGERDALQSQMQQLGKELHTLLGRIEAATGQSGPPLTSTGVPQGQTKS
jgi:chromosome segregation ATPase